MKLIVQIPAFNEETTIAQTLRDIPKKIDGITSIETLVIDDGSSDHTADAARKAGASHVVQLKTHSGLSAAFRAGIDAALRLGADVIVNTDADNQYHGADIPRLIAPIVRGTAEVVIGDREVATSPHMSPFKRVLQRAGSWTVGLASGVNVTDVTSGFRAFSREAALQINVFNPFTYTLETIIQSGNRNLGVQSVTIRTNAPTRPSHLYRGIGTYLRKSASTIFRIYTIYKPLKTFFAIGMLLLLAGFGLGARLAPGAGRARRSHPVAYPGRGIPHRRLPDPAHRPAGGLDLRQSATERGGAHPAPQTRGAATGDGSTQAQPRATPRRAPPAAAPANQTATAVTTAAEPTPRASGREAGASRASRSRRAHAVGVAAG